MLPPNDCSPFEFEFGQYGAISNTQFFILSAEFAKLCKVNNCVIFSCHNNGNEFIKIYGSINTISSVII